MDLINIMYRNNEIKDGVCYLAQNIIQKTHVNVFDVKFIRPDQKQPRNGEACRTSPTCFWSSLINLLSNTNNSFQYILHQKKIERH